MKRPHTYAAAGVNLTSAEETVARIRSAVERTYTPNVLAGLGAFGGLFDAASFKEMRHPVLVASADGVGTKTKVAAALGRFEGLGRDLVNHCVNDILVQGARPLFFLDYVAASRLEPPIIATIVESAASACVEAGAALLGGETAEMPGVYAAGELDVVGTIIGVVEKGEVVDGSSIVAGDAVLALLSSGLHTNGYSLARAVLAGRYDEPLESTNGTVGDALLLPHRSYLSAVRPLLDKKLVRGMAHVTGGGIPGNLPRVLPDGLGARIRPRAWPVPPIFSLIQQAGEVEESEMRSVFNMGAGFLLVVAPEDVEALRREVGEDVFVIGEIVEGSGVSFG